MKRMARLAGAVTLVLGIGLAGNLAAAERTSNSLATTKELPAALQALGGTTSQIVSTSRAQAIRGEGGKWHHHGHHHHGHHHHHKHHHKHHGKK